MQCICIVAVSNFGFAKVDIISLTNIQSWYYCYFKFIGLMSNAIFNTISIGFVTFECLFSQNYYCMMLCANKL